MGIFMVLGLHLQDNVAGCLLQTATTQTDIAKELSEYEIKLQRGGGLHLLHSAPVSHFPHRECLWL
jgi:hypothetical protein